MSLQVKYSIPTVDELSSLRQISLITATSPYWKKMGGGGTDEQIAATLLSIMLFGRELGISPMLALAGGIHNIQGKFEISARMINQLIRSHGHELKVIRYTSEICTLWGKRKDTGEELQMNYHIEQAARAGLIKEGGPWKKYPNEMLFARCISLLGRQLFADCIGGAYVEGELQEAILKKSIEQAPDVPEIEISAIEEEKPSEIVFEIPEDVSRDSINEFLEESARLADCKIEVLIVRANNNPAKFLSALRAWEDKKQFISQETDIAATL